MFNKKLAKVLSLAMVSCFVFSGCVVNKNATVISVNGGKDSISVGYAQFVAKYYEALYESSYLDYYGTEMWSTEFSEDQTMEEYVKDMVVTELEEQYVAKKHAKKLGIELTKAEEKKIDKAVDQFMDDNTNAALKTMGATEDYVKQYLEDQAIYDKVTEYLEDNSNVTVTEEEAAQRTFSYVCFSTSTTTDDSGNTTEATDEDIALAKSNAEALAAASDFDTEASSLNAETQTESYGSDHDGSLDDSIYDAADKLSEGQISDVIEVEDEGYYVLRLDSAYDESATKTEMSTLKSEKEEEYAQDKIDSWVKSAKFKLKKKVWKQVKFDKYFNVVTDEES